MFGRNAKNLKELKLSVISLRHDYLDDNRELSDKLRQWQKSAFEYKIQRNTAREMLYKLGYELNPKNGTYDKR